MVLIPSNEPDRLASLHDLHILDTPNEPMFDELVRLTSRLLQAPIASLALIDEQREWIKACVGATVRERSRAAAFCSHTILNSGPMIVEDALLDDRFASNPQVIHDGVRAYAGVALRSRNGHHVGSLCVKDRRARAFTDDQRQTLVQLGRLASWMLDLRLAELVREDVDHLRDEFLATVTHELRTPLTSVLGFAELLCGDNTPAERAEFSATLLDSGREMLDQIDELLDHARLRSGRAAFQIVPARLAPILNDARALAQARADRRSLDLAVSIRPGTPTVIWTDPMRLRQAIGHLLDNAIRCTPSGSVRVIASGDGSNRVSISVLDTGEGIPAAMHAVIFEPFRQLGAPTRRRAGFGLGLSSVRQICELLGGRIELDSTPCNGSRFTIILPVAGTDFEDCWTDPTEAVRDLLEGRRVLVAVASARLRAGLARALQRSGASADTVGSGPEALAALTADSGKAHSPYDAAVIDLALPRLTGQDVAQTARARGCRSTLVALSSLGYGKSVGVHAGAGFDGLSLMPIDIRDLIERLSRRRGQARREAA